VTVCVCVFITAGPNTKLFVWGDLGIEEDMCYERLQSETSVCDKTDQQLPPQTLERYNIRSTWLNWNKTNCITRTNSFFTLYFGTSVPISLVQIPRSAPSSDLHICIVTLYHTYTCVRIIPKPVYGTSAKTTAHHQIPRCESPTSTLQEIDSNGAKQGAERPHCTPH